MLAPSLNSKSSACYLIHTGFFLGLFFEPEDGGACSSEMSGDFQQTTLRYIPEDRTFQDFMEFIQK
jgi:hypothetical protein